MIIKTIKNQGVMLEEFAKQLHDLALEGKIKPLTYNQQQTSTLRYQRFKLNHNKFTVMCEDGEEISRIGFINFAYEVIKKGNEGIGIDFTKARFPFVIAQIRSSAIIDVEEVEGVVEVEVEQPKEEEVKVPEVKVVKQAPLKKARVKRPKE